MELMARKKDNVVSIDGEPISRPRANKLVVATLGAEIERAKSGDVGGIAMVRFHHDGSVSTVISGQFHRTVMAGAVLDLLDDVRRG